MKLTKHNWITAVLLVVLAFGKVSLAQTDAYSVEVAVADRGAGEQQAAYAAALRRVLLNNSGDKTLLNRDEVRAGLRQAQTSPWVRGPSHRAPSGP